MIGMCTEGTTLLDKFKILRDAGFEGVELNSPDPNLKTDDVLSASRQTGITVHGVVDSTHWSIPLNVPDPTARKKAIEDLKTAIHDAKSWGASSVLLVPAVVNKDLPYDSAWELSAASIREALPVAEECKIRIAIENVWNNFHLSPLEAARYVDEFKSPWVCWHLDLGNLEAFGWGEQWTRILGKRVWKLHIKEYSRKKLDSEGRWKGFVDLLEGDNNWPAIMKALDDIGYTSGESRWATAEVGGGDAKRMKDVSEKMDKIFAM
jgi:hexulose-6-phosphate isomerase